MKEKTFAQAADEEIAYIESVEAGLLPGEPLPGWLEARKRALANNPEQAL